MTDPQLPAPTGAVPPVPPAPQGAVPPPAYPAAPPAPYQAPPGAYQVPVGGYGASSTPAVTPDGAPRPSSVLGIIALILSAVAAVVTPIVVGIAGYEIGRRIPEAITRMDGSNSLAFLSPARDQVLWAELSFWAGTLLGIAAIVLGIVAIVRRRGRGQGIAALIVAVVAPLLFFVVLVSALAAGGAAGTAGLYS